MSLLEIDAEPGMTTSPAAIASVRSSRLNQRATSISTPSTRTSPATAFALNAIIRLDGNGHGAREVLAGVGWTTPEVTGGGDVGRVSASRAVRVRGVPVGERDCPHSEVGIPCAEHRDRLAQPAGSPDDGHVVV